MMLRNPGNIARFSEQHKYFHYFLDENTKLEDIKTGILCFGKQLDYEWELTDNINNKYL